MREQDKVDFGKELARAMSFYDKTLKASQLDLWFELLAPYSIENCLGAMKAHMANPKSGKFAPRPADLIEQIQGAQPMAMTADEAWNIAMQSFDERETVITNDLIDSALMACQAILDAGDKIGARRAFIAAYERLLSTGAQQVWRVSLGHDPAGREAVLAQGVQAGLITQQHAAALMPPAPASAEAVQVAGLLGCSTKTKPQSYDGRFGALARKVRDELNLAAEKRNELAKVELARIAQKREETLIELANLSRGAA